MRRILLPLILFALIAAWLAAFPTHLCACDHNHDTGSCLICQAILLTAVALVFVAAARAHLVLTECRSLWPVTERRPRSHGIHSIAPRGPPAF